MREQAAVSATRSSTDCAASAARSCGLGTKVNSSGASSQGGPAGDTPVSVHGLITASDGTRIYQPWYCNAAAFCAPSTFNLTNSVEISWVP